MGVSLDVYRARIGAFNCTKSKVCVSDYTELDLTSDPDPPPSTLKLNLCWKTASLSLLLLLLNAYCLASLLIGDGCVEANPGPTTPTSPQPKTRQERQEDILAKLVCETDNATVKDVLRLYKLPMSMGQLKKSLNKAKAPALVATMEYLGATDANKNDKSKNIERLIIRIQALFPDTCALCKADYAIHRTEFPLLSCAKCNQGIHSRCLAQVLGVAEVDLDSMSRDDVMQKINPLNLNTMVYLCGYCHEIHIPEESDGLRLPSAKPHVLTNLVDADDLNNIDSDDTLTYSQQQPPSQQNNGDTDTAAAEESQYADNETDVEVDKSRKRRLTKTDKKRPICAFYRKGECRHGISGKGCPNTHPKLCHKLMIFGDKRPRGCTKGKECEKFHPKMCPSSLLSRECLDDSCTLYHVKGTRRLNSKPKEQTSSLQQRSSRTHAENPKPAKKVPSKPPPKHHEEAPCNPQQDFLAALNAWTKQFMTSLDQKLLVASYSQITAPAPALTNPHHTMTAPVPQGAVLLPTGQLIQQGQGTQHLPRF